ncbi:MAG TPA: cobyrinate a,c-diamide synthase [Afifellaceae bacterium]|nr:cobyrinate a,c-diamide synthase [Afifellaceae bacterium]
MEAPSQRGLIIAAAASHSGKTVVTLGLIAALRARGHRVAAAKCGPDYIDPRFLAAASGREAVNLDPWAMRPESIAARLAAQARGADFVIIEGVMGLYDGGSGGAGSTADLARLTGLPVVLVVSAQSLAQSAAAMAAGFARLADGFDLAGAIVNGVASDRHAALIGEGFETTDVPLLGLVRRDRALALKSRHLGLVQASEHEALDRLIGSAGEVVADGVALDRLINLAGPVSSGDGKADAGHPSLPPLGQNLAVARDTAFAFAYPHLLSDWQAAGASVSIFSPLGDEVPAASADAVYLPGGYPELYAGQLAAAGHFQTGLQKAAAGGALIYGECGGYMALGEALIDKDGKSHAMAGLLPLVTSFEKRKLSLGYRRLRPLGDIPFPAVVSAHEFHYSTIVSEGGGDRLFASETVDGEALGDIGLRRGRIMGSFAHIIDIV